MIKNKIEKILKSLYKTLNTSTEEKLLENYLKSSSDIADLENRMKKWESNKVKYYF